MRVAFLGPAGTYTHDALLAAAAGADVEVVALPSVFEAIAAVERGDAERAFVPFENSIEGAVRSTLDTLAFDTHAVTIAGARDHAIRHSLIARRPLELAEIEIVISHEQASAQCARFVRERLGQAITRGALSTAEAVRLVAESEEPWAALGSPAAAELYGAVVLSEGVEDQPDNVTRFVWIAPEGTEVAVGEEMRTTLVFSELGEDHPGALVDALTEFSSRAVNLTRLESRPLRRELGRYMFFVDVQGASSEQLVAEAIRALRGKAESVRILGSYPARSAGIP